MMVIVDYFLYFIIYSFFGWLWETGLYIVRDKRFVNRGFLNGTLCPIYGAGASLCVAILYGRVNNPVFLFLFGLIICTSVEYVTHFALEKIFHATWWDYSKEKFNIKGRVCLVAAVFFGICITVLILLVQPFVAKLIGEIPTPTKIIIAVILYSVLLVDTTLTVNVLIDLNRKLKILQSSISETIQSSIDSTEEKYFELKEKMSDKPLYPEYYIGWRTQSLLKRYPEYKSLRYKEALENVRKKIQEKRRRK